MNELVKVNVDVDGIQTVNARELHEFLESGQKYIDWIKNRISKYDFVKGEDFTIILGKSNGGRPSTEYHISIDMAKELSMVENNDKGREARKYFIAMEKKAKRLNVPQSFGEALLMAGAIQIEKEKLELKNTALQIELDKEQSWYSVKRIKKLGYLPGIPERKIWNPLKVWSTENDYEIRVIPDVNYESVNSYHRDAWNSVYGLNINCKLIGE